MKVVRDRQLARRQMTAAQISALKAAHDAFLQTSRTDRDNQAHVGLHANTGYTQAALSINKQQQQQQTDQRSCLQIRTSLPPYGCKQDLYG
jgi:hypothetical protein